MLVLMPCPSPPVRCLPQGLLHEAVGNGKKALHFYMIAAHLTPSDLPLWRRLAALSAENGLIRQAIYCYTRVSCCSARHPSLSAPCCSQQAHVILADPT